MIKYNKAEQTDVCCINSNYFIHYSMMKPRSASCATALYLFMFYKPRPKVQSETFGKNLPIHTY